MTTAERKRLARYTCRLAVTLGLRDWTLNFPEEEPTDKKAAAAVATVYGRRIASVWFSPDFLDYPPEQQRHIVVHELLHIHLDPIRTLADSTLPAAIGVAGWAIFEPALRERVEHAVDAIADALACALPLPE